MVNVAATSPDLKSERRERARADTADHGVLGQGKLNPYGDLHTLQHLSARLARGMRGMWEPLLRQEVRCWAEPLVVQRFADYRAERGERLTAWLPLTMTPGAGSALLVLDGRFVLELLDLFFGGTGAVAHPLPAEFSPAGEVMVARLGAMLAAPLKAAWEPLSRIDFLPLRGDASVAAVPDLDGDDAAIVTRFGIAAGTAKPVFVDIIYPVAALKPHGAALTGKVLDKAEADPAWRNRLTRAVMDVAFPIRSVLAEPVVPLQMLIDLKPGDVIPISFGPDVPVMVCRDCLGTGTVGTANGRAAVRLTSIARLDEGLHA
ncbi:FliM/FliN family flagellar motor switch protein [Sphingomonas bacterium]|uniref:FliM/FliN family flagellar motor switch protein n=1 Tax=Sphingomonas bacterium TaxID=1895847 RepID=UPI00157608FA|nr:flagellar motor switch protein FliM [Sphingomonas bacterium]